MITTLQTFFRHSRSSSGHRRLLYILPYAVPIEKSIDSRLPLFWREAVVHATGFSQRCYVYGHIDLLLCTLGSSLFSSEEAS
jgi:hypothetical protein